MFALSILVGRWSLCPGLKASLLLLVLYPLSWVLPCVSCLTLQSKLTIIWTGISSCEEMSILSRLLASSCEVMPGSCSTENETCRRERSESNPLSDSSFDDGSSFCPLSHLRLAAAMRCLFTVFGLGFLTRFFVGFGRRGEGTKSYTDMGSVNSFSLLEVLVDDLLVLFSRMTGHLCFPFWPGRGLLDEVIREFFISFLLLTDGGPIAFWETFLGCKAFLEIPPSHVSRWSLPHPSTTLRPFTTPSPLWPVGMVTFSTAAPLFVTSWSVMEQSLLYRMTTLASSRFSCRSLTQAGARQIGHAFPRWAVMQDLHDTKFK